jgi:hypothetical protein
VRDAAEDAEHKLSAVREYATSNVEELNTASDRIAALEAQLAEATAAAAASAAAAEKAASKDAEKEAEKETEKEKEVEKEVEKPAALPVPEATTILQDMEAELETVRLAAPGTSHGLASRLSPVRLSNARGTTSRGRCPAWGMEMCPLH